MTPSAAGTLADTPLAHALVYARNRHLTGRLELAADDERRAAITIWRGRLTDVETTPLGMCPGAFFGAVAYELGFIDAPTLDASLLEIAKTKRLHGEVLVARGAITSAQRDEALVEQIHRKVHYLFSLPSTTRYAFYDARIAAEQPPVAVDSIGPVWRGIRDFPPERFVLETMRRIGTNALRATTGGSARLPPSESRLVHGLAGRPMTVDEMKRATDLPAPRVELLVYLLVIAKCVEAISGVRTYPSTGALPLGMPSGPPSGPPPASGEVHRVPSGLLAAQRVAPYPVDARAVAAQTGQRYGSGTHGTAMKPPSELGIEGIRARAEAIDHVGPFELLGLTDGAPVEAVRAAYIRLAKLWHPDRLAPELVSVRPEVMKVFARIAEAQRTLCDEDTRHAHTARSASRPPPITDLPREAVLREAEARLSRRDFAGAGEICQALVDANSDDADALALAIWASVSAGEASETALRAALPKLDRAVLLDRTCDRALYLRGLTHKQLGNVPFAFRDFARALHLNPRHIDAEREVRLFAMRARKGSGEHKLATNVLDKVTRRK